MTELAFKKLERLCASLLNGQRYPANTGGVADVESETWAGQCKLLRECSLEQMTQFAESIQTAAVGKGKRGVLFIKVRRGRGTFSPVLAVMVAGTWKDAE